MLFGYNKCCDNKDEYKELGSMIIKNDTQQHFAHSHITYNAMNNKLPMN